MMENAPLYEDVAKAPEGGQAYWLTSSDGVRIRIGVWDKGTNGTVLLFPGRTEYVEKYGQTAGELQARGYAMVSVDWRGQGLADRFLDDVATGHVMHFSDYQHDVKAMVDAARELGLPEPLYLLSHSMGGCIALRSLIEALDVKAAVFIAPMWGILMSPPVRPVARGITWVSRSLGLGHKYAPGTNADSYVVTAPFAGNLLTTDPDMYAYMQDQAAAHPQLPLGGPSMHWLFEALTETRALQVMDAPVMPTLVYLGTNERIIDSSAVVAQMESWPDGHLEMVEGAEHEVLMEQPAMRTRALDGAADLFGRHR
ncbi:MAG: alpha/beta hydrolase [Marinosulfonomonas sp.]|nr:alpha/beta hydrolase [Marinosulfonomonas sp.]